MEDEDDDAWTGFRLCDLGVFVKGQPHMGLDVPSNPGPHFGTTWQSSIGLLGPQTDGDWGRHHKPVNASVRLYSRAVAASVDVDPGSGQRLSTLHSTSQRWTSTSQNLKLCWNGFKNVIG